MTKVRLPRTAQAIIVTAFASGLTTVTAAAVALARLPQPDGNTVGMFVVFTLLVGLTWVRPIVMYRDNESEAVHLDEGFLVLLVLLVPSPLAVMAFAVSIAAAQAIRRRPLVKSLFNWGQVVTAAGLGVAAGRLVGTRTLRLDADQLLGAAVAAVVFFVVNSCSMSAIVSSLGTPWQAAIRDGLKIRVRLLGGCIAVGAVTALAISAYRWSVALAVLPLLLQRQAVAGHYQARHDRTRLRGLFHAALEANRYLREDDVVAPILASARTLLRAPEAAVASDYPQSTQLSAEMSVNGELNWLAVTGRGRNEPFDAADTELLQALAAIGAGALSNAAMYEEIRQQRERISAITVSLGEGVCAVDSTGLVTFCNPAATRMLGWADDASGGMLAPDFLLVPAFSVMHTGGILRNEDTTFRHPDGTSVPIALTASAILESNRSVGAVIVFRDMSERQELEQTRARLVAFLDGSPDFVALTDRDGNASYVNPAGRTMLGLGPDESLTSYRAPDFRPAAWTEAVLCAERDGVWRGESIVVDREGRELTVHQVVLAHSGSDGDVEFFSTTARDITELRRLELHLHESQKMHALGQLAGGVAHDFNNVLAVISLCSELLAASVEGKCLEFVSEIHSAASRAAALTDQLLTFSRREHFDARPVDPGEVIVAMQHMLTRLIGEHIEVTTDVSGAAGCFVEVDRGRLEQVVMNLVLNARDAMPDGGTLRIDAITVELGVVEAVDLAPGAYVQISVSDTGVGMSADIQSHLFEPFFTTKPRGEGTGLGLATVQGIIAQSRGHIGVESHLGVGTTLTVHLPVVAPTELSIPGSRVEAGDRGKPFGSTILLVEDEIAVRRVEAHVLETAGYRVLQAGDGIEGLEMVARHGSEITLILTDVLMPRLSGPELVDRLRLVHPELKVLFASGYTEGALTSGAIEGDVPLLYKPFAAETLLAVVSGIIEDSPVAELQALLSRTRTSS